MNFRTNLKPEDLPALKNILASTGYFHSYEIDIAIELAEENLSKGPEKSGYSFVVVDEDSVPVAFACYGKTPCTEDSYDLYWIAVHEVYRGHGIGKTLLIRVEGFIGDLDGKHIWVETSSRPIYASTRKFYLKMGYRVTAELPHFYAKNDNKIIFVKRI